MIGLSVAGLFYFNGKILGISNILSELLNPRWHDKDWRLTFVLGLLSGGALLLFLYPPALSHESPRALGILILGGLLVGYGASLGRGCTSGHGICGITRLSPRSLIATAVFMSTGMITVYVTNHLLGWAAG